MQTFFLFVITVSFVLLGEPKLFATEPLENRLRTEGIESLADAVEREGDAARGAVVFHQRKMACNRCHETETGASLLGPNLAKPQGSVTAAHIVESILMPSKKIGKAYRASQIVTDDGRILTGIIRSENRDRVELVLPFETGKVISVPRKEIEDIVTSPISMMPVGQTNQLADRREFLDLARYVLEIGKQGPVLARRLRPDESLLQPVDDGPVDHAEILAGLESLDLNTGRELYMQHCVSCHGKDGNKILNPLARRFTKDPLKFGTDPYSMWKTISYGNGLMFPQAAILSPEERYAIVHFIRETFLRKANPSQYFVPDVRYLASVNERATADAEKFGAAKIEVAAGMIDGTGGRRMEYGNTLCHSVQLGSGNAITERAFVVQVPGNHAICYDTDYGSVAAIWTGTIADTSKTHHTSHKGSTCMRPGGDVLYSNVDDPGFLTTATDEREAESAYRFAGYHLHSGQVVLEHSVGGRRIRELPGAMPGETILLSRTFEAEPSDIGVRCLIGRIEGGTAQIAGRSASLTGKEFLAAISTGADDASRFVSDGAGGLWLELLPSTEPQIVTVWWTVAKDKSAFETFRVPEHAATPELAELITGGPRQWSRTVRTQGILGDPINGYAADELTLPYANPWGSWMRPTAIDFFPDGRAAVSTLSGDVFLVSWTDETFSDITWSRFATGLYEPLGLKIVEGTIYVRGRDRITRLHDLNRDGEADSYENFHQEGVIGSGYHAFLFDLQTDRQGNFYYTKSGRKSPHDGAVVRVSPDGKSHEFICHDFRHPNGMGAGGPNDWVTVTDNPDGNSIYNGVALVREGGHYGYLKPRTVPMLAVLPSEEDSSSGGQCWADESRWGLLSGQMIHTSYSRCKMFYVLTQNVDPHPNGFAVPLPFEFKSGVMRTRVNPADGQVYVVGQKGWSTNARHDGCLYRIRSVEMPTQLVTGAAATSEGIRLSFSFDVDPNLLEVQIDNDPAPLTVLDNRTVLIAVPKIEKRTLLHRTRHDKKSDRTIVKVQDPLRLTVTMRSGDQTETTQRIYATINSLPEDLAPEKRE